MNKSVSQISLLKYFPVRVPDVCNSLIRFSGKSRKFFKNVENSPKHETACNAPFFNLWTGFGIKHKQNNSKGKPENKK